MSTNADPSMARPAFDQLLADAAARAVQVPVLAVGLGGSARISLRDDPGQDLDLVVIARNVRHTRVQVVAFGRTLDIALESPESIAAEFDVPRRADLIRLLSEAQVLSDSHELLTRAVECARALVAGRAPLSVFPDEFSLSDEVRDLAGRFPLAIEPARTLIRAALLERIVDLAFLRVRCWPAPRYRAIQTLALGDARGAERVMRAIEGDDAMLRELAAGLVSRIPRPGSNPYTKAPPAVNAVPTGALAEKAEANVQIMPPAKLARLSTASASSIHVSDLQHMSKLQLLTIQRVHGADLSEAQRDCISAILAG